MTQLPEMFDLKGRTAIVTGGAGLLGAEFCKTLAEAGAALIVADRDQESTDMLVGSLTNQGFPVTGYRTDITSIESVHQMVNLTIKTYGQVDILVNSAALDPKFDTTSGQIHSNAFEDYPLDQWQQALDVNLTGTMLCCQAVSKPMLEQNRGVIVNIASMYGIAAPDQRLYEQAGKPAQYKPAYYAVTKAGILGLTRYLAAYYSGKNIRVNSLTPGGIYDKHSEEFVKSYSARSVIGRMAEKDEMNGALLFLVSDASRYMTGANLVVDGGWTTW